jgi:hypothetical protein
MSLRVYNVTGSPVTQAVTGLVIPASASPPARGAGVDVTSELRGLTLANYVSLQAQSASLVYEWVGAVEYPTGTLAVVSGRIASRLFSVGPVAAKGTTDVHALIDTTAITATSTGFTNPDVPRNLRVTKAASWDGGTVTITGTNQFDEVISETFSALGAGLEVGTKIFKTVTSSLHSIALDGGNGYSIGTGDLVGLPVQVVNTVGFLWVGTTAEAVTIDATVHAFTPTTLPSATTYKVLANVI